METVGADLDWPAWVQAIGSIAGIFLAATLPYLDQRRRRREYGRAAFAAAELAHREIAGAWYLAGGEAPDDAADMEPELRRVAAELDAFPLLGSASVDAVLRMRELARCCHGVADLVRDRQLGWAEAISRVANYAHHLLFLMADEVRVKGPPPPHEEEGVPPQVLAEVAELRRSKRHPRFLRRWRASR